MGPRLTLIILLVTFGEFFAAQSGSVASQASTQAFPAPNIVLRDAHHKEPKSGVQFGPRGQLTITSGVGTPTAVNVLAFSPDVKFLAAGKDFGRVVIWDFAKKKVLRAVETQQGMVKAVSFSPDSKVVATGGSQDSNSVKTWDFSRGQMLWAFKNAPSEIVELRFVQDGRWLVVRDNAANLYVLDAKDGKLVATLSSIHAAFIDEDDQSVVTADAKEFSYWSSVTWSKTRSVAIPVDKSMLLAANLRADEVAVYARRAVRVVQVSSGKVISERGDLVPKNFTWQPTFAGFSSDGVFLYLSLDDRLQIVDTKQNGVCSGPVMYSGSATLSGDGQWLAGAKDDSILSKERTDSVWIWNTGQLLSKCGMTSPSNENSAVTP